MLVRNKNYSQYIVSDLVLLNVKVGVLVGNENLTNFSSSLYQILYCHNKTTLDHLTYWST